VPRLLASGAMTGGTVRRRVLVALGLVTACTLAFQVVLSRLLSAILAYHFSYLAISLALLGTGAGALFVYLVPRWFEGPPLESQLARWSALYGGLLVLIPFALVRLNFHQALDVTWGFAFNLAAACVLAAVPAFAAGVVVALAINGYPSDLGRVYAFDLVGAGLGAFLVVPLLWVAHAPTLIVLLGLLALVAALLFAPAAGRERAAAGALAAVGMAVLVVAVTTSALFLPPRFALPDGAVRHGNYSSPLARVMGYQFPDDWWFSGVYYDRDFAPVPRVDADEIPDWEYLQTGPQSIGYELTGPGRTFIIGGGGGRDIYNALSADQNPVDVVELNEPIRKVVDEDLGDYSGRPYSRDGVNTTIGDGRAILAGRDTKYDTIHIGFTNTLAAGTASGFVLTENNLYTLEALDEYFEHLTPDGVLNFSRVRVFAGDEGIRATVLALAALERQGVENPEHNIVVFHGRDMVGEETATILARIRPYTDEELDLLMELAEERSQGVLFAPDGPYVDEWEQLADADGWRDFCHGYHLNVCPPTDDKPFFFNMTRLGDIGATDTYQYSTDPVDVLLLTLGILLVLSLLAFFLPLRLARDVERPTVRSLSFFAAIGLGFLLLEIALVQRFILFVGFPAYALSVVLFALLVFTGIGSALSARFANPRRALTVALTSVIGLTVISAFGLQRFLASLLDLPFPMRVALSVVMLAPLGLALGMCMPIGLQRFRRSHPTGVPYAWGVNGVASVLASVLGVAVAINFGFRVAALLAAVCYLGALVHVLADRWTEAEQQPGDEGTEDEAAGDAADLVLSETAG
jgi:spermidine synthase